MVELQNGSSAHWVTNSTSRRDLVIVWAPPVSSSSSSSSGTIPPLTSSSLSASSAKLVPCPNVHRRHQLNVFRYQSYHPNDGNSHQHHHHHHHHHLELLIKFEGHSDDVCSTVKTLKQLSAVDELTVVSERIAMSKGEFTRWNNTTTNQLVMTDYCIVMELLSCSASG